MSQNICGIDEPGHSSGHIQVSNVGFGSPYRTELLGGGFCAESLSKCSQFDGITKRRSRTVRFDIADRVRAHSRSFLSHRDDSRLTLNAGGREAYLGRAVII